jgi:hypothetical protein
MGCAAYGKVGKLGTSSGSPYPEDDRMSALVVVLAAGMATGDSPDKGSTAVAWSGLSLDGRWEGTSRTAKATFRVEVDKGMITWTCEFPCRWAPRDEGDGRFSLVLADRRTYPCIYKWDGDRLVFCIGKPGRRPKEFTTENGQELVTLHRVKPEE